MIQAMFQSSIPILLLQLLKVCQVGGANAPLKLGDGVWRDLAQRALMDTFEPASPDDVEKGAGVIYADYLRYLNDIGLGISMANFELAVKEQKEKSPLSDVYCTPEQLREWESYSMAALDSGLPLFIRTYCGLPCQNIHDLWSTVMDPVSCVEEATKLYRAYDCVVEPPRPRAFSAAMPFSGLFPWDDVPVDSGSMDQDGNPSPEIPFTPEDQTPMGPPEDPPDLESHYVPEDEVVDIPAAEEQPKEHRPDDGPSHFGPPLSVKGKVSQKAEKCQKAAEEALITTYAPAKDYQIINDHFDPAWVSTPFDPGEPPVGPTLQDEVEASNCKTAQDSGNDRVQQLRASYMARRDELFYSYFARYHVWTFEEDADETVYLRSDDDMKGRILSSTDTFFLGIIDTYDPLFGMRPCADAAEDGGSSMPKQPDDDDDEKEVTPKSLTESDSPFLAFVAKSFVSILDNLIGTSKTGTDDTPHPPQWDAVVSGALAGDDLKAYSENLQTKSPQAYAEFIDFLRINNHDYLVEITGFAGSLVVGAGISKAAGWTVAKAFSVLSKIETGFTTNILSSAITSLDRELASFSQKTAFRLKFWWEAEATPAKVFDESALQFRSQGLWRTHYKDHSKEWGDAAETMEGYLGRAQRFFVAEGSSSGDVFVRVSKRGDYYKYDAAANEFGVVSHDGFIKCFYKPQEYMEEWWKALEKYP